MVWGRVDLQPLTHMKIGKAVFAALALGALVMISAQVQPSKGAEESEVGAGAAVIAKLESIVEIRERMFEGFRRDMASGLVGIGESSEADLVEAQVELANAKGDRDGVVGGLKRLVEVRKSQLEYVRARAVDRERMAKPMMRTIDVTHSAVPTVLKA